MLLKIITPMAGVDYTLNIGDETNRFDGDEAASIIRAGYAVPVAQAPVEKAVKKTAAKETR